MSVEIGQNTRVLMLLENYHYPQDVRVRNEASTLKKEGYQVTVVCPRGYGQKRKEEVSGVRVYRYPCPPMGTTPIGYVWEYAISMAEMFRKAIRVFVARGFDIIHLHNPPDTLFLVALPFKIMGKTCVYDHHDLSAELYEYARFHKRGNKVMIRILVFLEKLSHRCASHVVVTNESYKRVAIQRAGIPPNRVTVVRNGPDPVRFRLSEPIVYDDPVEATIGYCGTIGFQDGLDHLIRAVHYLVTERSRKDVTCNIAGTGAALNDMKALARDLRLDANVRFLGSLSSEEVVPMLRRVLVGVAPEPSNPYNDKSTMIKIMEYMAVAKPVVAFDLPEHRATAGDAALYALPNDDRDLALKIEELIGNDELRVQLGRIGRQRVIDSLSWNHQGEKLVQAYEKLTRDKLCCTGSK